MDFEQYLREKEIKAQAKHDKAADLIEGIIARSLDKPEILNLCDQLLSLLGDDE